MADEFGLSGETEASKQEYGNRVYLVMLSLMLIVAALFSMKARWQHHVPVRQVSVEGVSVLSHDEIVRLMRLPPNVPMFDIDLTAVQKNILSNSFVKSAVIQRDAPSTLRVIIEERKPAAIVVANVVYYIAGDGTLLPYIASSETYDIPVITGIDSLASVAVGKKMANADVRDALEIIRAAKAVSEELFHAISEIRLRKGKEIILYSFETGVPILFGRGDAVKKMVVLEAFWKKFIHNNETPDLQYIDIRFDDQVVVAKAS